MGEAYWPDEEAPALLLLWGFLNLPHVGEADKAAVLDRVRAELLVYRALAYIAEGWQAADPAGGAGLGVGEA